MTNGAVGSTNGDAKSARTLQRYAELGAGFTNGDDTAVRHPKRYYERGAGLTEYALLIALIALIGIASVRSLGQEILGSFIDSRNQIGQATIRPE